MAGEKNDIRIRRDKGSAVFRNECQNMQKSVSAGGKAIPSYVINLAFS